MKKKHLKYGIENLMTNADFISWAINKTHNDEFENLMKEDPGFRNEALMAKRIIYLLRESREELQEEEIISIWHNIERFDSTGHKEKKFIRVRPIFRIAAIFLFLMSMGCVLYYFLSNKNTAGYEFASTKEKIESGDALLLLSNGGEVTLKKDNSTIALNDEEQLRINNDSIIDLKQKNISATESGRMNEVITPFGKKSQVVLEDGTKVWLNAGSRFAFPTKFIGENRRVFLEGEAYFEVAGNEQMPFHVDTREIDIRVVGTRFNVSAYASDETIESFLVEGKLAISEQRGLGLLKKETYLLPYQLASFNRNEKTIEVRNEPNADIYIAWTLGWFKFSRENLLIVLKKLERFYSIQFIFPSDFNFNELITGKLDLKESPEQVMRALADVADIEYRIDGSYVRITKTLKPLPMRR